MFKRQNPVKNEEHDCDRQNKRQRSDSENQCSEQKQCDDDTFDTKVAYINGTKIQIQDYKKENHDHSHVITCVNDHELEFVEPKSEITYFRSYFRHKNTNDIKRNGMTEWHKEWQSHFDNATEVKYGERRCDAEIKDYNTILEFQHSYITEQEVYDRNQHYHKCEKNVIWIVDGKDSIAVKPENIKENEQEKMYYLEFVSKEWKYKSFMSCDFIFIDINQEIYKVYPNKIKNNMVSVQTPVKKDNFITYLKHNSSEIWKNTDVPQCTLNLVQLGAGNGKTYSIIQRLRHRDCKHYKYFIAVSFQHSAKHIIYKEFEHQHKNGDIPDLTNIKYHTNHGKQFTISYVNPFGTECKLIIGTMDSWTYQLGNKNHEGLDKFKGIVQSIIDGFKNDAFVRYGGINLGLNKEVCFICDETQDLTKEYGEAIIELMKNNYFDSYIVADLLQSIRYPTNAFTYLKEQSFTDTILIRKIINKATNQCRRFSNKKLINFVNEVVPFTANELPIISVENADEEDLDPLTCFEGNFVNPNDDKNKDTLVQEVDKVMEWYKREVNMGNRKPNDFLIITLFTQKNPFIEVLEQAINDFWINKEGGEGKSIRYAVFHKSQEGQCVRLDESEDATRLVSVHTAKGDGRKVVFVIGLDEQSLLYFSDMPGDLVYESLLHVALTRMKERLYVRYINNNDDIHQRIRKFKDDSDISANKTPELTLSKKIDYVDLIESIKSSKHFDFAEMKKQITEFSNISVMKESKREQLIDWNHHTIRYASMLMFLYFTIINHQYNNKSEAKKQISAIFSNIKNCKITECDNWKTYSRLLMENYKYNHQQNDQKNENKTPHLLLLKFSDKHENYNRYYVILKKTMQQVQKKINSAWHKSGKVEQLCPFQSIVLYYMIETYYQGIYADITILELYRITHDYYVSFLEKFHGHNDCQCLAHFYEQRNSLEKFEENNKIRSMQQYLTKEHYEKISNVGTLYLKFLQNHPDVNWLIKRFTLFDGVTDNQNQYFEIRRTFQIIGSDSKDTFILYVQPDVNLLNIDQIKIDSLFDTLLIKRLRPSTKKDDNFDRLSDRNRFSETQRNITTIVFSLSNPDNYYEFKWQFTKENENFLLNELQKQLEIKYVRETKQLYHFFETELKKNVNRKKSMKAIINMCDKKKDTLPTFVRDFFLKIDDQVKERGIDEEDFFKKLHERIKDSISTFFIGDDDDTYEKTTGNM